MGTTPPVAEERDRERDGSRLTGNQNEEYCGIDTGRSQNKSDKAF